MRHQSLPAPNRLISVSAILALVLWGFSMLLNTVSVAHAYEVWLSDQSDTGDKRGGTLYIYDGATLVADPSGAKPTVTMDLAGEINTFCLEATGKGVRRPHMIFFTNDQSHAIISFLTGQVLIMDAETRKPEACVLVGKNVHAAWPTPNQKMLVAANIKEKQFARIWTDYGAHQYTFDARKDVLSLGGLESGDRPDAAPICPITDASSHYAFITLRGGGLFVVDVTQTPMLVVATLDNKQIHPAGCGGVQVGETMYVNSGGGWPAAKFPHSASLSYDVYALNLSGLPKSVSAKLLSSRNTKFADAHGMVAVGRYLWNADRAGNNIEIFDTVTDLSVGSVKMAGRISKDPAPDLLDAAPDGSAVFAATRGVSPLTGNDKSVNNAKGSSPGIAVIKVTGGGKGGQFIGLARVSNLKNGKETADPHGIAVRK